MGDNNSDSTTNNFCLAASPILKSLIVPATHQVSPVGKENHKNSISNTSLDVTPPVSLNTGNQNIINNNVPSVSSQNDNESRVSSSPGDSYRSPCSSFPPTDKSPDGGWGWVVVFAAFMNNMISDGVSLSLGTIFVELSDYFDESKSKTSWVLSIILSIPLLAGPIASYLTDRYGCRSVCIAGALLATTGFIISFVSNSLVLLYFTFTISGFGLALVLVTSVVIIPYYFEKKRALATGLSVCGTGIGTFLFPPLVSYLLETYSWRGAFLILSGFFLNTAFFGCLMRDLEDFKADEDSEQQFDCPECVGEFDGLDSVNPRLCNSLLQLPTYIHKDSLVFEELNKNFQAKKTQTTKCNTVIKLTSPDSSLNQRGAVVCALKPTTRNGGSQQQQTSTPRWSRQSGWITRSLAHNSEYLRKIRLQRGSLTYRGAMLNIPRYRLRTSSCPDIYRNSIMTISESAKKCPCLHDMKDVILDMVDVKVFNNLRFTLFCLSNFLLYACVDIPYVYLQDYAIMLGYDKESSSLLISILGILNTLGVVIVGFFGDKRCVDSALVYAVFVVGCGVSMALMPFLTSYACMALLSAAFGFTISANYTLVSIIIVDLTSLDNFTSAYGMLLLVQGIASLVGPPVAGWLYDLSGTYDTTFFSTGISIIISGILVFPVVKAFGCGKQTKDAVSEDGSQSEKSSLHQSERVRFQDPHELGSES